MFSTLEMSCVQDVTSMPLHLGAWNCMFLKGEVFFTLVSTFTSNKQYSCLMIENVLIKDLGKKANIKFSLTYMVLCKCQCICWPPQISRYLKKKKINSHTFTISYLSVNLQLYFSVCSSLTPLSQRRFYMYPLWFMTWKTTHLKSCLLFMR